MEMIYNWTDENVTYNATKEDVPTYTELVLKWTSLLILLGIICSNIVVIVLLYIGNRKSRMGFFVANLAIADFAVGLMFVLPETMFNRFNVPWNPHVCYIIYAYFSIVPFFVSTYAIVVISIDRAYVILKPLAAASKGKLYRYGLALSSWAIGCILAIPYGVRGRFIEDKSYCNHEFISLGFVYLDLCTIIIVPVIVISICYILMIVTIRRRERFGIIRGKHNQSDVDVDVNTSVNIAVISKAKIRTIKLLFVIVVVYIICWAPIMIDSLLLSHGYVESGTWSIILYVLAPINSLANPLVFLIFNRKMFRRKITVRANNN
ncbi:cardioacceleratory peptide receptor-like [Mytilus californianus]|uniref:cardioacceleratory peptide receptor-like n=1 Tax=Mytilus californianus TaxID=6549 RepID=UPI0022462242|nr:cardioacceleratory peptide receptor-like [Mytilus californianus]XP_052079513.1 cardioacceleratory peptide receptor-like [Mytilus californianus]